MSDDYQVTPGAGATMRVLTTAAGKGWPAGVTSYATTVADGANVLQVVTPSFPLPVAIVSGGGGGSNAAASATGSAVPASADFAGLNVGGTLRGRTGVNPSGTVYAAQTDVASVGGAAFALGQQLAAASVPVVLTAAQVTTLTPTAGAALEAGNLATIAGAVSGGKVQVQVVPSTSGGGTPYRRISTADTNAAVVKASAGQVLSYTVVNTNTSTFRYLKFYDKASAPTVGTDATAFVVPLPPAGGANLPFPDGLQFTTGIALAITGGMADNDATAIGAAEVVVSLSYK